MDVVELPILPAGTKLKDALSLLRQKGVSGLVVETEGEWAVLDAAALLGQGRKGADPLSKIIPTQTTIPLTAPPLSTGEVWDAVTDVSTVLALDAKNARFGISRTATGRIAVVTRQEKFAQQLRVQMSYCICQGPLEHVWAPGDLHTEGQCNLDEYAVDCD